MYNMILLFRELQKFNSTIIFKNLVKQHKNKKIASG